jgi:hypothetical protein
MTRPHAGEIKFEYGIPQVFRLKFLEPKSFDGSYGVRGMYTAADEGFGERKIWMDWEQASNLAIELRALGIRAGEPIRVTKVKHDRGGGHGYLVARADERSAPAPRVAQSEAPAWVSREDAHTEALLEKSVQMVREHGREAFRAPAPPPGDLASARAATSSNDSEMAPGAAGLAGALMAAVDAALEATAYAARKGLELTFSEESIRALAATVYIQNAKGGR